MSSLFSILQYGLSVTFVGMGTVFIGLIILIGLIKLLEVFVSKIAGKKAEAPAAPAPAPAPVAEEEVEPADDGELVAVIAAAVAAAMEAAGEESGFVVRSIRRVHNAPAWNRAGREEQVYSRM